MDVLKYLLVAVACAACSPDVGPGTYYCGPQRLCPDSLVCDEISYTCETEAAARKFACPDGAEGFEPDSAMNVARDLGAMACKTSLLGNWRGCVTGPGDVDYMKFENTTTCGGVLRGVLAYPRALISVKLEAVDEAGNVIGTGENCTKINDYSGTEQLCLNIPAPQGTTYVRVVVDDEAADCNGECHHNQYVLSLSHELS